ncbi:hypothetical protein [Aureimonas sp. AU12]|uniref:hypothetical protein n=1 Tax=Aureimonas sp. AU12 TaxID=1638161 RepID=UPI000784B90F|nr:hypothetical protein [Aureimonas sp. AU12]
MTDTKEWWKSKTVWGGLVALIGALGGLFGLELDGATQDELAAALAIAASAVGALVAILGRLDAKARLG